MISAIGEVLPLAVGIAISPLPIIAAILMLLSPQARKTSIGFTIGWVAGIVVGVVVFTALSSVLPAPGQGGSAPASAVIRIVLGVGLLLLAMRQWRSRPRQGETAELPPWLSAIDKLTFGRALGLGFALAAVNPKNLLMAVSAGVAIGALALPVGNVVVVVVIYTAIAACTVLVPVVAYLVATARMSGPLEVLRRWLAANNAVIMAVLLLVLGVSLIGKGLGQL